MNNEQLIETFLSEIRRKFPEVIPLMDKYDSFMLTSKMEAFATLTTNAFNDGNIEQALQYLNYINAKLKNAKAIEYEYIDVYYVEHLFWLGTEYGIKVGWPVVPKELKKLYLDFHGQEPKKSKEYHK